MCGSETDFFIRICIEKNVVMHICYGKSAFSRFHTQSWSEYSGNSTQNHTRQKFVPYTKLRDFGEFADMRKSICMHIPLP